MSNIDLVREYFEQHPHKDITLGELAKACKLTNAASARQTINNLWNRSPEYRKLIKNVGLATYNFTPFEKVAKPTKKVAKRTTARKIKRTNNRRAFEEGRQQIKLTKVGKLNNGNTLFEDESGTLFILSPVNS